MYPPPPTRGIPARPVPARPSAPPTQMLSTDQDDVLLREFGSEFDAIPLPDRTLAQANALVCDSSNLKYIKSKLPMAPVALEDFYQQMAKRSWQKAQPFVARHDSPKHVMRGMLAIGARRDLGANAMQTDPSRPLMPHGHAADWDQIQGLKRVNAYVFRGDKRNPRTIKAAGGLFPPSSRTDDEYIKVIAGKFAQYMKLRYGQDIADSDVVQYIKGKGQPGRVFTEYQLWRAILKNEELHVGKMVVNEFMKGFISTTRNIGTAYYYASQAAGAAEAQTAVYALHSEGGFLLPPQAQNVHGSSGTEAEVAHPGPLPWKKVVGFRTRIKVDFNNALTFQKTKYAFIRKGLVQDDPEGAQQILWTLASME